MRRKLAALPALFLCVTALLLSAAGTERVFLSNECIEVIVERKTGRFCMRSTGGNPVTSRDDTVSLLYDTVPSTSYTAIAFNNGKDLRVFGERSGKFVIEPTLRSEVLTAVWKYRSFEVSQFFTLVRGPGSEFFDCVNIAYSVLNGSSRPDSIGLRILLDTALSDQDGIPFKVSDRDLIESEYGFAKEAVPQYWYSFDNYGNPSVRTIGTLRGEGVLTPDRIIFAAWRRLDRSGWPFEYKKGESFRPSTLGRRDSAVGIVYDCRTVAPGQALTASTTYGLYGTQQISDNPVARNTAAPHPYADAAPPRAYPSTDPVSGANTARPTEYAAAAQNANTAPVAPPVIIVAGMVPVLETPSTNIEYGATLTERITGSLPGKITTNAVPAAAAASNAELGNAETITGALPGKNITNVIAITRDIPQGGGSGPGAAAEARRLLDARLHDAGRRVLGLEKKMLGDELRNIRNRIEGIARDIQHGDSLQKIGADLRELEDILDAIARRPQN